MIRCRLIGRLWLENIQKILLIGNLKMIQWIWREDLRIVSKINLVTVRLLIWKHPHIMINNIVNSNNNF